MHKHALSAVVLCSLVLAGCQTEAAPAPSYAPADQVEAVFNDQLACKHPTSAGTVMMALLDRGLAADTHKGGDGTRIFVATEPLKAFGFDIKHIEGFHMDLDGTVEPFIRAAGTTPNNFLSVSVHATPDKVRARLAEIGINESELVKDASVAPRVQADGEIYQPWRQTSGPEIEQGDLWLDRESAGVTTIRCSRMEQDFEKDLKAQLGVLRPE